MHTSGFRIVSEEIARGDYHSVRLMCMWGAFIMGALTYLSIKSLDYPGNVISATLSELKEGIIRGQVITFPIAAVLLLLWFILIKKSQNLLEEIKDNCILSIITGVASAIVLSVCTYAVYSTTKYTGSRSVILILDFLGMCSLVYGIVGLVVVRRCQKKRSKKGT